jgi:hypothetical protein
MNALALLTKIRNRGIQLAITDNGRLRIEAPEGMLSSEIRQWFQQRKPELVAALSLETRIRRMAARWQFTPEELAEELARAAKDPARSLAWVAWDEHWTGGGTDPFKWN